MKLRLRTLLLLILLFAFKGIAAASPFRVGVALPLSGPVAEFGDAYRRGIKLAMKDLPEAAANIEIVYEDHRYDMSFPLPVSLSRSTKSTSLPYGVMPPPTPLRRFRGNSGFRCSSIP